MTKNDTNKTQNGDEELEQEVDEPEEVLEVENEALKKLEQSEAKYKRALADYQNLEKRVMEDRRSLILSANKDLMLRLLPVLDTLILASKHDKSKTLEISISQFLDIIKGEGVVKLDVLGEKFDPNSMECVSIVEGEDGKVIEEVRAGYILGEKLLRPAQVLVGEKK